MEIISLDHFVLTVRNIEKTCEFYQKAFNLEVITFGNNRKALRFGKQKINLHQLNGEIEPKARNPTPGSADFCLITTTPLPEVIENLKTLEIAIALGIVERTGAQGRINSIYIRDPDLNLIEIANYLDNNS